MSTPQERRQEARQIRIDAAKQAFNRPLPKQVSNGDDRRFRDGRGNETFIANFTKGLPHNAKTGLIANPSDYNLFVKAINSGEKRDIEAIPLGTGGKGGRQFESAIALNPRAKLRAWESMAAGLTFDLEGPDAQAVAMPPAPELKSIELAFEMSELYWMALLRDVPFSRFQNNDLVENALKSLNNQPWVRNPNSQGPLTKEEAARQRPKFSLETLFRGDLPGDNIGPYLSQFLLVGTEGLGGSSDISDGFIQYGGIRIDQRVRVAKPELDFMTTYQSWLDVQHGADLAGRESYVKGKDGYRFMATPRDLATYVHYDALYQAYLNACLILLDIGADFDEGIPYIDDDFRDKQRGFATFGGPHILTLVTEVATRALKAVRFQKYNVHRRLRPEALAQLIDGQRRSGGKNVYKPVEDLESRMDGAMLRRIREHNRDLNRSVTDQNTKRSSDNDLFEDNSANGNFLLPMAFAEGSPMHPSYGAGHATVAGACVTVLKAFFDTEKDLDFQFVPTADGSSLQPENKNRKLKVGHELNKLCSNVSIGRNWGGVHYYSDYRESIKIGEDIALGILEEQIGTYPEKFSMTVPLFDGKSVEVITNRGLK